MNKNKILKTIFIFLIILSLTTTFVVSASASSVIPDTGYTVSLELYLGDYGDSIFYEELGPFPCSTEDSDLSGSLFIVNRGADPLSFEGFLLDPYTSYYVFVGDILDPFSNFFVYPFSFDINSIFLYRYLNDGRLIEISSDKNLSMIGLNLYQGSVGFWPYESTDTDTRYIARIYGEPFSSDSPIMSDSVSSGLTSSLGWVGQVVGGLTTGPIAPLLGCFAVTISVSAVLLGIYSIRRFIWGS